MTELGISVISNLDKAKALVKEANLNQAIEIINESEALRVYAEQANKGLEIQNQCAEVKIRAERRAGELLAKMEKHPAGRPCIYKSGRERLDIKSKEPVPLTVKTIIPKQIRMEGFR